MNRLGGAQGRERGGRPVALALCVLAVVALLVWAGLLTSPGSGEVNSGARLSAPHSHAPGDHAPGSLSGFPWSLAALGLLAVSCTSYRAIRRSTGRAALVSLSLLVGVFALESAVHSTHHLADAQAAAGCVVLAASEHLAGAGPIAGAEVAVSAPAASPAPLVEDDIVRPLQSFRPFEGRAPPAAPSA